MASRLPYFIIESNRPFFTVLDRMKSLQFADLKKQEVARTLPKPVNATIMPRAEIHVGPDAFFEDYYDREGGVSRRRYKAEIVVAQADNRGRIFIASEKPELARAILRQLRDTLDYTIKMDDSGCLLPEEMPEEDLKPVNKGGRPRRVQLAD